MWFAFCSCSAFCYIEIVGYCPSFTIYFPAKNSVFGSIHSLDFLHQPLHIRQSSRNVNDLLSITEPGLLQVLSNSSSTSRNRNFWFFVSIFRNNKRFQSSLSRLIRNFPIFLNLSIKTIKKASCNSNFTKIFFYLNMFEVLHVLLTERVKNSCR